MVSARPFFLQQGKCLRKAPVILVWDSMRCASTSAEENMKFVRHLVTDHRKCVIFKEACMSWLFQFSADFHFKDRLSVLTLTPWNIHRCNSRVLHVSGVVAKWNTLSRNLRTSVIDSRNCASGKDCTSLKRCLLPSKKGHSCPVSSGEGYRERKRCKTQNTPRKIQAISSHFKPGHFPRVYSICEGLWSWQLQGSPCQWRMWIVSAIPWNRRAVIAMAWRQQRYV